MRWVGEGVIKWANTKFMAKMATKKKGGSRGTHTHKKRNEELLERARDEHTYITHD